MAKTTEIGWAGGTWNVVTGCTKVSPGCAHCYIETTIPFRTAGRRFERVGNEETTGVLLHPERLERRHNLHPSKLDDPIFVCSLSDLFHPEVPDDFIHRVLDVIDETPERTFLVLTKRPERMRRVVRERLFAQMRDPASLLNIRNPPFPGTIIHDRDRLMPPNLWLGTTIENARYVGRARVLASTPAALRFLSCEPLLGTLYPEVSARSKIQLDLSGIGWVIAGGESGGTVARPMHPAWARELRDDCAERGIPFWFKQWGSWRPADSDHGWSFGDGRPRSFLTYSGSMLANGAPFVPPGSAFVRYMGHSAKSGGADLDGVVHEDRPPLPSQRQEALA